MKRLLLTFLLLALELAMSQGTVQAGQGTRPTQAPASVVSLPARPVRLKDAVKDFPRSQLQFKNTRPVSIDTNQGVRASFETLAEIAELNIIFDADFRDTFTTPLKIDNADILDAFDLLSIHTGNFVEVLDSRSIIVAPDNPTKHREYDLQVLKTFYLKNLTTPQGLTQVVTAVRTLLQARYIAINTVRAAIVIRDTPDQIVLAEKLIADLDSPKPGAAQPAGPTKQASSGVAVATNAVGHLFVVEADGVHTLTPNRSQLQFRGTGPRSFKMNQDSRASFETLAAMAGLNIVFDRDFRSVGPTTFSADNVDVLDALDLLSLKTRSFWEVLDSKTIMVAPDNQTKRWGLEPQIVKTFYLSKTATKLEGTEIVTALRTLLNCRYVAIVGTTNAIAVRDVPDKLALAEKIISDLGSSIGGLVASEGIPSGVENGLILDRRAARALTSARSQLQPAKSGPLSLKINQDARAGYEAIVDMAGLHIVFDSRFQDRAAAPFQLEGVDIHDALDFLSLQTGNIWETMDSNTVIVAPDNQAVSRELEPRILKTISLAGVTPPGITEIVTALRTLLNLRQIEVSANAIVIQDTAGSVALAERIVTDLVRPAAR